jgi:hypothetical protein
VIITVIGDQFAELLDSDFMLLFLHQFFVRMIQQRVTDFALQQAQCVGTMNRRGMFFQTMLNQSVL